ncbi:MAG: hypothetical protein ATN36_04790 [Epulopiscium sp. Nele67-Bin005]|nr:MAG: hypothetical protein ATN36_04790 [Epulopiscium sp. Nele67-Bin005]
MSDRRTIYTKQIIKKAFLHLLNDHSLEQLTVKGLCLEADINRATFYRHYQDIYYLFEEIRTELLNTISVTVVRDMANINFLTIIYNNQGFYTELFRTSSLSSIILESNQCLIEAEIEQAKNPEQFDFEEFKYSFEFYIYGLEGLLKAWLNDGCELPPEQFAQILKKVTP